VQVRPGRLQAEPVPRAVDQQERRDLLHLLLHRHQPDQVGVEGVQDLVDARRAPLGGEGDRRVYRQGRGPAVPLRGPRGPRGPHGAGALRRPHAADVPVGSRIGRVPGRPQAGERHHDDGGEPGGADGADGERENTHGLS